jgi:hypothetical protein
VLRDPLVGAELVAPASGRPRDGRERAGRPGAHRRSRAAQSGERTQAGGLEDLCCREQVGRRRRLLELELRDLTGLLEIASLDDRHRPREASGRVREAVEPEQN